ncbi:20005_t:CDS:2 [Gigaspora margarita]|uniref:20005_t:CDS:1 n=1 Tax=Gigaspora margarita TaxID=4874 RepID=A0ABN7UCE8_GIGMA|nr:20005_t:CDS:2 [Gigaspora margarita]
MPGVPVIAQPLLAGPPFCLIVKKLTAFRVLSQLNFYDAAIADNVSILVDVRDVTRNRCANLYSLLSAPKVWIDDTAAE